ncbi:IMPACT family member yigZ [Anaerobiospirillum thomasii]|uniref:YigZ family protein n=1 Tax=Anaerobiospirillum thomasii TaxID=179995 RepID=UPI000D851FB5|nr:YigZ family protein [Anaerobiospirillum thomasii]SPT67915.1 IMPACT family member yigZ [Anaerobiospirillum thomasii]
MSKDIYQVPCLEADTCHRNEIIIKKSRFITSIGHTKSTDEAKAFIEKISCEFSDARHNCFAFNATAPGSTAYCGCSDDGEPKGTAGQPMLTVVLHCGVGELTAVVTRYFGGILLGTGGLVKAYQDSVKEALATLPTQERMIPDELTLIFDMRYIDKFLHMSKNYRLSILNTVYTDKVLFDVILPKSQSEDLIKNIKELTRGDFVVSKKS